MTKRTSKKSATRLCLYADTAADLMTSNPLSLRSAVPVREAIVFLADNRLSAAPVIDDAGRPVGVLSRADLLGRVDYAAARPSTDLSVRLEGGREVPCDGVDLSGTPVREIMTPGVVAVGPDAPVDDVVGAMLASNVHRLYVVGGDGTLAGVISSGDILRHLRRDRPGTGRGSRLGNA